MQSPQIVNHPYSDGVSQEEIQRYITQVQNKREYNRRYYQERTKTKRETEKQELQRLREVCSQLQSQLDIATQNNNSEYEEILSRLLRKNDELQFLLDRANEEKVALSNALEVARQRNYQLMMVKADSILPKVKTVSQSPSLNQIGSGVRHDNTT